MIEYLSNPAAEILAPADTAAVAEAVREAAREGRAVYPRGGGTHWNYGVMPLLGATAGLSSSAVDGQSTFNPSSSTMHQLEPALLDKPAVAPCVTLSLEKMNRLVDHAADDMTVTVEAGMTFAELSKILAAKKQRLPIDVREPEKATLGGLVAVNLAGPRQFGYGTIRDYLLGFTAVDGEGTIFQGGGRVVKNAAGYNMTRLMAGALGTLSILTQLTFMVRPLPELSAIASCDLPNLETAEKLLTDLNKSQVRPVAIELVSRVRARTHHPAFAEEAEEMVRASTHPTTLLVGFEGTAAEVRWMLDTLQAEWQAAGVETHSFPCSGVGTQFPDAPASAEAPTNVEFFANTINADVRIAVRPGQVVELIAALREKYPDCTIQSHAGNGIVLVKLSRNQFSRDQFSRDPQGSALENVKELYRQLRSLAESFDGKMTVLVFPENIELSRRDIWGPPSDGFTVMQSLKDRFDPHNILNPGRFIFE